MATDRLTLSRKDYADYEFIVKESEHLLALGGIEERMKYYSEHKEDALSTLWGTEGRALECTRQGAQRFNQIVARGLEALGPHARRHSASSLVGSLRTRFVDRAIEICANTTEENAHDIFDSLVQEVEKKHKELTHYIPCSFAAHKEPAHLAIGPVCFVLRDIFMQENDAALRHRRRGSEVASDWPFDELQRFFSKYDWVASVRVPPCDPSVSKDRAHELVQRVLDLFKLVVGGDRAARVRQAYDLAAPNVAASLTSSETGEFSISCSRRVPGAIVPDDWYRQMSEFKPWQIGESIISAHWEKWGDIPEPQQRFLDGLSWHGDALSDADAQAAILKFWTAIERVVSLKDNDPVTRRASVFSVADLSQFPERFKQCQRLYTHRSKIIHGTEGYKTPKSSVVAIEMEDLSKRVLLFYLSIVDGLKSKGTITRTAMQDVFDKLDAVSRKFQKLPQQGPRQP